MAPGADTNQGSNALTSTLLFLITLTVFWVSPVHQVTESRYSMLLSQGLLEHRSFALDLYNIPRLEPVYHDHTWKNGHIGQLELVGDRFYYYLPPGSSVLSVPFVAVLNVVGISARNPDGTFNPDGEIKIERILAALLMAALSVVLFFAARLVLPRSWSVMVALGAAFGTQVWSTNSRALWADTWGLLLLGVVVYLLLADELARRRLKPVLLASLLSWTYFVRPTNAAAILAVSCYILWRRRQLFLTYILTGMGWLLLFVLYSWIHYRALLPTYFRVNKRLSFEHFATAVAGNLISPSRGLLVFVPVTVFVLFIALKFRRSLRSQPLFYLATTISGLYLLVMSTFNPWWAGASYGPRYLAPVIPWIALLAVLGLDALRRVGESNIRALVIAGSLLLSLSIVINGVGAISHRAWAWNTYGDIDHDPKKVWNLRHSQILAAFLHPPLPDEFPLLTERLELSSPQAEKYLGFGWSGAEQGFRWTDGSEAAIIFAMDNLEELKVEISLTPFLVNGRHERQRLEILMNDVSIQSWELRSDQGKSYEFRLPRATIQKRNVLTLRLPDAASPNDFKISTDERRLGVAVHWIKVSHVTN